MIRKVVFKDGSSYDGEISNGTYNGRGIFRFANGNCYDGEWKDGKMHGFGILNFVGGDYYEGDFIEGKYHGMGKYVYANGSSYSGEWQSGLKHGHGKLYSSTGKITEGVFEYGALIQVIAEYNPKEDSYDGFNVPSLDDASANLSDDEFKNDPSIKEATQDKEIDQTQKTAISDNEISNTTITASDNQTAPDNNEEQVSATKDKPTRKPIMVGKKTDDYEGYDDDEEEDEVKDYSGDFIFEEAVDCYYVTTYVGNSDNCVIPANYRGKIVKLGYSNKSCPLLGGEELKAIIIERGIEEIGVDFFRNCSKLLELTIPITVRVIKDRIFAIRQVSQVTVYCEAEEKPEGWADKWTVDLDLNTPNNGIIVVWDYQYNKTSDDGYYYFISEDGNKYGIKGKKACFAKYLNKYINFVIPSTINYRNRSYSVTKISTAAFNKNRYISHVEVPASVESIGCLAFSQCYGLTDVTLPNKLSKIGMGCFACCTSLSEIRLPNNLTAISDRAFYKCSSLRYVELPNNLIGIGEKAFSCCYGLLTIDLPKKLKGIDEEAFSECTSCRQVYIPRSVALIGSHAFPTFVDIYCEREKKDVDSDTDMSNFRRYNDTLGDDHTVDYVSAVEEMDEILSGDGLITGLEWNFDDVEYSEMFLNEENVTYGISRQDWDAKNE